MNDRRKIIVKLEGYMKLRKMSKQELAKEWNKSEAFVYRRFSEEVEFSLTDIIELIVILNITRDEAIDIFFN